LRSPSKIGRQAGVISTPTFWIPEYLVRALTEYGYEVRDYQAEVVSKSLSLLITGVNVGISLPPGTGKTLIGQMIASLWLSRHSEARVLCVVPNTNLLVQHYIASDWAFQARLWTPLKIDSEWRRNKQISHDTQATEAKVWLALPTQFERATQTGDLRRDLAASLSLVIVDEFDSFSKVIISDEGNQTLAFKDQMLALRRAVHDPACQFVFMSATPPKINKDKRKTGNVWERQYTPVYVSIPKLRYAQYIPVASAIPIGISDAAVYVADHWIRKQIAQRLSVIKYDVFSQAGVHLTLKFIIDRIEFILRSGIIVLGHGNRVRLKEESLIACRELNLLKHYRLKLFEDLSVDITNDVSIREETGDLAKGINFARGMKSVALVEKIRSEMLYGKRIVVFVRFVATILGLVEVLRKHHIDSTYAFGDQSPAQRQITLDDFKAGKSRVLFVSRELFGRGFDLPEADTAIIYSPKDNVRTIWQEFLRIRSTYKRDKKIYILFYLWTAESSKMERLLRQMWAHGANRARKTEYEYSWEFTEEERTHAGYPGGMHYYDFEGKDAASFWKGSADPGDAGSRGWTGHDQAQSSGAPDREEEALGSQRGYENLAPIGKTKFEAAEVFCKQLIEKFAAGIRLVEKTTVSEIAKECNLFLFYADVEVAKLVTKFTEVTRSREWKDAANHKLRISALIQMTHPDRNTSVAAEAMALYHDLTVCLIQLRQAK
jgi:superfamily II DNA or RNA helicase